MKIAFIIMSIGLLGVAMPCMILESVPVQFYVFCSGSALMSVGAIIVALETYLEGGHDELHD